MSQRLNLSPEQRLAVDALKGDGNIFINCPRHGGKSFLAAVAVSEMADELGGIWVATARGEEYFVPPGTPWQEALPARADSEAS